MNRLDMNFIIPNDIIEEMLCDSCNQYLTVLPVKIYPSGIIRCGRCTRNGDEGTSSLYNVIVERCIIRCINRFDGCKELLIPSQVNQHEELCNYRIHKCPLCLNAERTSTFLFKQHFYKRHSKSVLKYPICIVNTLKQINKYFLYEFNDNLFLIRVKNTKQSCSTTNLTMNLLYLGEPTVACGFQGKVFMNDGVKCTVIDIPCLSFPNDSEFGTTASINIIGKTVTVFFTIKNCTKNIFKMPVAGARLDYHSKKSLKWLNTENLYFHKRNIFLNEKLCDSPLKPTIIYESYLCATVGSKIIYLNLNCLNCSLILSNNFFADQFAFSYDYNYWKPSSNDKYYRVCFAEMPCGLYSLLCYDCSLNKYIMNNLPTKIFISRNHLDEILYFCIWKCGKRFFCTEIYAHELTCKYQKQIQSCPVNGCTHIMKLHETVDHFTERHPLISAPYVDSVVLVNLNTSKSPINITCLVSNVVINVEFLWNEPYWTMTLNQQFEGVEPRDLIYSVRKHYIDLVKERGTLTNLDYIYIKCYLIIPNKMLEIEEWLSQNSELAESN